jgi:hydrogenase maturation protein HypF
VTGGFVADVAAGVRRRVTVSGVVQGVGFRPFVHRLAGELGLSGSVGNALEGVVIEVEGPPDSVGEFERRLVAHAPALSQVESVQVSDLPATGGTGFNIVRSGASGTVHGPVALVPPDTAVCADCLRETFDPSDRRARYPFTACTYCGPRFTMVTGLPYDRPFTTMAGFPLCPRCQRDYEDPADRRFHAQPTACPECGPSLTFRRAGGPRGTDGVGDEALAAALSVLEDGGVVAVKGVGGYHLACDGTRRDVVAELRRCKQRPDKPFAVLVPSIDVARKLVDVDAVAERELCSPVAPIVVLPAAADAWAQTIAESVAPRVHSIGVMLAHTPLHHLLFHPHPARPDGWVPEVLVFTSANLADEPICTDPDEAEQRLSGLADAFLHHDRPIHVACDDSVERVASGAVLPVRRSRGHAPLPVRLPLSTAPLLAVGGELKATACVAAGERAWLSQHLGDVASLATLQSLERAVDVLCSLARVTPEAVVADLHPGYLSHRWARERARTTGASCLLVQHHHAHLAALLAEHAWTPGEPVLGFAFDGTGYGHDGTVWGGELLVGSYASVERVGHLAPVALPGGDAAVRHPSRMALSHLAAAGLAPDPALPLVTDPVERRVVAGMLGSGAGCVPTTSMGRLFDAVAALVGRSGEATYEGQAAIELEVLSERARRGGEALDLSRTRALVLQVSDDLVIDPAPLVRGCVAALLDGASAGAVGLAFHEALAAAMLDAARRVRRDRGIVVVGLTGGVFQNALLSELARASLAGDGFTVLEHHTVPANDGGLALGQAAVAAAGGAEESG